MLDSDCYWNKGRSERMGRKHPEDPDISGRIGASQQLAGQHAGTCCPGDEGIAVNTFIHNALKMGMPASVISRFTGIQKDQRFHLMRTELSREMIKRDHGA